MHRLEVPNRNVLYGAALFALTLAFGACAAATTDVDGLADSGSAIDAPNGAVVDSGTAASIDAMSPSAADASTVGAIDADVGGSPDASVAVTVDAAVDPAVDPAVDAATIVIADAGQGCVTLPLTGSLEILGQLTTSSPVFNRPINCDGLSVSANATYYNAIEFCAPPVSGAYDFLVEVVGDDGALSMEDSFISTYVNGFIVNDPLFNCFDTNDDRSGGCPPFSSPGCGSQVFGTPGTPTALPTAVVTTFGNGQTGSYRVVITRQ